MATAKPVGSGGGRGDERSVHRGSTLPERLFNPVWSYFLGELLASVASLIYNQGAIGKCAPSVQVV